MNAIKYKKLTVFGGKQWRPFAHVREIGEIIVNNLNTKHIGIYNLAQHNAQIIDIAKKIQKSTKCELQITEQKFEDDRNYHADISKGLLAGLFAEVTLYTIDYGIKEVKELVLSNRIKNLELEYYSNEKFLLQYLTPVLSEIETTV